MARVLKAMARQITRLTDAFEALVGGGHVSEEVATALLGKPTTPQLPPAPKPTTRALPEMTEPPPDDYYFGRGR